MTIFRMKSRPAALALALAATVAAPLAQALDLGALGGVVDRKTLDQIARDKLGVKTDAGKIGRAHV